MKFRSLVLVLVIAACELSITGCQGTQPNDVRDMLPEQVTDFTILYNHNCSGCHGVNGTQGAGPRLNDPLYLALVDKDSLYNTIKHGRPGTPMPAFGKQEGGPLTDQQVGILVDSMRTRWAKPVDLKGATLPVYSVEKAPPGDAARGQIAYQRNCMMCHGFGKFKGAAGPVAERHYMALTSNQGLRTTMITGRPDWGMPDWRHRIPGHPMSDQEISDVTAWLASLRPPYVPQAIQGGPAEPHPPAPHITTSLGQSSSKQGK